jgi:hypothetical protein
VECRRTRPHFIAGEPHRRIAVTAHIHELKVRGKFRIGNGVSALQVETLARHDREPGDFRIADEVIDFATLSRTLRASNASRRSAFSV